MKIALVDDDGEHTKQLAEMLTHALDAYAGATCSIAAFSDGDDFLATFRKGAYDLIVLDIYVGTTTGVDLAYEIRRHDTGVLLVFCTSSNEFASECFDVSAKYYLRKPITQADVQKMLTRLDLDAIESARSVQLPNGRSVRLRSILYTEYTNHVVTVHCTDQPPLRLRASQTEIEALLLPFASFVSPYKGITVNLCAVTALTDNTLTLTGGVTLPVTRRKTKEIKAAYDRFRMNEMKKEIERF